MVLISRMHDQYLLACVDESAHRVFRDKSLEGQRAFVELGRGPYTILARLLLPALGKAVQKFGRNQTYADAARVACALERYRLAHGALPDNLEALTPQFLDKVPNDIMDGKPLRYHRTSDGGYTLYSVGWNQTDDGGQLVRKPGPKEATIDLTQGDWVWQMPPG